MKVSATHIIALVAFTLASSANAFVAPQSNSFVARKPLVPSSNAFQQPTSSSPRVRATAMQMSVFDGVKAPVQSYVDIWTPMFKSAQASGLAPDFLLHWGNI